MRLLLLWLMTILIPINSGFAVQEVLEVSVNDAVVTLPMTLTEDPSGNYASTSVNHQGELAFTFSLQESFQVRLDLFAMGMSSSADSFYLKHADQTLEPIHLGTSSEYRWKQGPLLNLEAGTHIITIVGRESYARIKSVQLVKIAAPPVLPIEPDASRFDVNSAPTVLFATGLLDAKSKAYSALPNTKIVLPSGTIDGASLQLVGVGKEGAPIIIEGQPDGSTILTGKINLSLKGSYLLVRNLNIINYDSNTYSGGSGVIVFDSCLYCGIHNSRFDTSIEALMDSAGKDLRHFKDILIKPTSQSVEVARNTFKTKRNQGSVVLINRDVNRINLHEGHRIFNNLFVGRHLEGNNANDFDVIRIGDSTASHTPSPQNAEDLMSGPDAQLVGTTVEFNVFEDVSLRPALFASCQASNSWSSTICKGEPEIISVKAPQSIIRFNTFRNNSGGVTIRHGYQSIIEGNYFSGKNIPQGTISMMPNSYGIRIIGENHFVVNNHMEDLTVASNQLGGIVLFAGMTSPLLKDYWQVFQTLVTGNFIKNGTASPVSFAAGYGSGNKTVLPESIIFSRNAISECSQAVFNRATTDSYFASFASTDNLYDCSLWGISTLGGATQVPLMLTQAESGFNLPSEEILISSEGILYNSEGRLTSHLSVLQNLADATAAERMTKLSQFLKIRRGTLYQNYSPQSREDVGSSF